MFFLCFEHYWKNKKHFLTPTISSSYSSCQIPTLLTFRWITVTNANNIIVKSIHHIIHYAQNLEKIKFFTYPLTVQSLFHVFTTVENSKHAVTVAYYFSQQKPVFSTTILDFGVSILRNFYCREPIVSSAGRAYLTTKSQQFKPALLPPPSKTRDVGEGNCL